MASELRLEDCKSRRDVLRMSDLESLAGCLGYFEAPLPPNGPCSTCPQREICRYVSKNFVPKERLKPILQRIERLQSIIREV